jgi:hypothetical protein
MSLYVSEPLFDSTSLSLGSLWRDHAFVLAVTAALGSCNGECAARFDKCGGKGLVSPCCDAADTCVQKNPFYAQCITPERRATNVAAGWSGEALTCTPAGTSPPSPAPVVSVTICHASDVAYQCRYHAVGMAQSEI